MLSNRTLFVYPLGKKFRIALLMILILAVSFMISAEERDIPPILYANWDYIGKTYPTWVSTDAAFLSSGEIDGNLFYPRTLERLESHLDIQKNAEGCIELTEFYVSEIGTQDRSSLKKAVLSSELVIGGRVLAREYGFDRGVPGQLFLVESTETFKGRAKLDRYYFFIPVGEFEAGEHRICKTDSRFAQVPTIGSEVILLIPEYKNHDEPFVDLQSNSSLITIQSEKEISFPEIFGLDIHKKSILDELNDQTTLTDRIRAIAKEVQR